MFDKAGLDEATIAGREAGRLNLASDLNPYRIGTPERQRWEHQRSVVSAQRQAFLASNRARHAICRYAANAHCDCGVRGLCLDVA